MYQPYGIIPPIITPFSPDGSINLPMLKQMSFHLIEQGIHGLFPFGTTGEFYAVGDKEYGRALEAVRDAATGRKKLLWQADSVGCRVQPHHDSRNHSTDQASCVGRRL